jgi:iron complex outermembrane receptor protein
VPNVLIATPGSFGSTGAAFAIRGAGQDRNSVTLEPGVGLYIDGVYMGRSESGLVKFADVERIEVLRGPQGTLFGKNTSGGAINIITARPGDKFAAQVNLAGGTFNRRDVEARVNVPFTDTLALKLSGFSNQRDGYVKRLATGLDVDDEDTQGGRVQLRWQPSDAFSIDLSGDYSTVDRNGVGFVAANVNPNAPFPTLMNQINPGVNPPYDNRWVPADIGRQTNATGPTYHRQDSAGGSMEINWDMGAVALKSLSAYRSYNLRFALDGDGTPVRMFETTVNRDFEQLSQEFQLSGQTERLDWVAGVFYFEEKPSERRSINQRGIGSFGNTERFTYSQETTSYAGFGQATYSLTGKLSTTLGLRYSKDEKELALSEPSRFANVRLLGEAEFDAFTPRVDLQYAWTQDVMTYVSFSKGFKGGGINDRIIGVTGGGFRSQPFEDERNTTYEAGLRSDLFNQRLRFNATYFYTVYDDLQQAVVTLDPAIPNRTLVLTQNIGEAKAKGVEVDFAALLFEGFTLNGSYGLLDTEVTRLNSGTLGNFRVGGELASSPKHSYTVGAEYQIPVPNGAAVRLRTDYNWIDDRRTATATDVGVVDEAHGVLGASVTYESVNARWSVSAYGKNITDELYYSSAARFDVPFGITQVEPAPPRELGVRVIVNFGG